MQSAVRSPWVVLGMLLAISAAEAGGHYLTIGGGYNPSGNQISLEKNAL